MDNLVIKAFESNPIFENIDASEGEALMKCLGGTLKIYKKDQPIPMSESFSGQIGIVISGCVHAVKEDIWGRRTFLDYSGPDGIFGETLFGKEFEDRGIQFKAGEPTAVLFFPVDRILHPCKNTCSFHRHLSRNLFNMMRCKNISLMEKIEITSKSSLREKILTYLSLEAQKCGSLTVTLPLNRAEMADYLCTNRSALSRELASMKKDGILDYDRRVFHLSHTNLDD